MAMSVGQSGGSGAEVMVEINTTPLIDVMLVLLIMLIITIPIQTHAVKLDTPRPTPQEQKEKHDPILLDVDFDGTIYWNGNAITRTQLQEFLRQEAVKPKESQSEIHLKPNRLAKYGFVAVVLADAQRIGVKRIGFVGQEQYMQ